MSAPIPSHAAPVYHANEQAVPRAIKPADTLSILEWAHRLENQPALVVARELSSLPDTRLTELASEYARTPSRPKAKTETYLIPVGLIAFGLSLLALIWQETTSQEPLRNSLWALAVALPLFVIGIGVLSFNAVVSLKNQPVSKAYIDVGWMVSPLDEFHPWLYRAFLLQQAHTAANAYRTHILAQRGTLRGLDYLVMDEIAKAHERLALTTIAKDVVALLQRRAQLPTETPLI